MDLVKGSERLDGAVAVSNSVVEIRVASLKLPQENWMPYQDHLSLLFLLSFFISLNFLILVERN